jgi:hypothetical protein
VAERGSLIDRILSCKRLPLSGLGSRRRNLPVLGKTNIFSHVWMITREMVWNGIGASLPWPGWNAGVFRTWNLLSPCFQVERMNPSPAESSPSYPFRLDLSGPPSCHHIVTVLTYYCRTPTEYLSAFTTKLKQEERPR